MLIVAVVIGAIVVLAVIFKLVWRTTGPNEALVISGLGAAAESPGFKVATGRGALVLPGFQICHRLSLAPRAGALETTCVTSQGIEMHVRGVVAYKVGDDISSIANAARRFLGQEELMDDRTRQVLAGHLRSIAGDLTVEDLLRDRNRVADQVRASSADELGELGLVVDSLQIHDLDDNVGYIENLVKRTVASWRIGEDRPSQGEKPGPDPSLS